MLAKLANIMARRAKCCLINQKSSNGSKKHTKFHFSALSIQRTVKNIQYSQKKYNLINFKELEVWL